MQPVLIFDLHQTITPDKGYPLEHAPYDGFRRFADRMVGRGCCLHIATGSLHDQGDKQVYAVRRGLVESYCQQYSLPISFIGGKPHATVRVDDRMVEISHNPDWDEIGAEAEARLDESFDLANGVYVRRNLTPVGEDIEMPDGPYKDLDQPRGYTTPMLDFDVHRTLNPAWGSSREAPAERAGVDLINRLYDENYGIQLSCPGWNPATRPDESDQRLMVMQMYAKREGIHYDRFVTKDDGDLEFDNRGVRFNGNWGYVEHAIRRMLLMLGEGRTAIPKTSYIHPKAAKALVLR